jgi:hypothetical protein
MSLLFTTVVLGEKEVWRPAYAFPENANPPSGKELRCMRQAYVVSKVVTLNWLFFVPEWFVL